MSDLLKVKVGKSSYLCNWTPSNKVEIGGRLYPYVKIGSQLWTSEDLALNAGNNISRSSEYPLYYSVMDTSWLNPYLPRGWRIPTKDDLNKLNIYLESTYQDVAKALKSTSWNGTNESGFNAKDVGYYNSYQSVWIYDRHITWTTTFSHTESQGTKNYDLLIKSTGINFDDTSFINYYATIRLVKDSE